MTDRKSIRRALVSSVLAIFLCCAMLVGTTFAWFTDMVTTGRNIIKSGNLDIELEYDLWDATNNKWAENWQPVDESTVVFDNELWEPGVTEVVRFKVKNVGTLALKYEMGIQVYEETGSVNVYNEEFKLSDYIWVGAAEGDTIANRAEAAAFADTNIWESANLLAEFGQQNMVAATPTTPAEKVWTLAIHMPTEVGNEANHLTGEEAPSIEFGVVLMATQLNSEADSYGPDYDENATYPVSVTSTKELSDALAAGKNAVLNANVTLDEVITVAGGKNIEIEGNGHTLTVPAGGSRIVNADGQTDVNIKLNNVKLDADNAERVISFYDCKNVNLTMNACDAAATHYAINIASNNENVNLVVEDCDITGFAAFQTWSSGVKATFRNCTLTGVNQWPAASGAFATIVINENVTDCELVFENCTVVAIAEQDAPQYHLYDNSGNTTNTVTWTDCTFKVGTSESNLTVVADATLLPTT